MLTMMERYVLFSILTVLLVRRATSSDYIKYQSSVDYPGTTPNLQEIFIGRCWDLQRIIRPELFVNGYKNCTDLWKYFADAFVYKEPCYVPAEEYRQFAEAAAHSFPTGQCLFWEKVYPFVNEFSAHGKRYTTIADSLLGYMADFLSWCGQMDYPGINYDECPTESDCGKNNNTQLADASYWLMTSEMFSVQATGQTYVLLNGSYPVAFDPTSIFATLELVHLTPEEGVTDLHIMVLYDIGGTTHETCGVGSILELENQARSQGLRVTCEANPAEVRHFQCASSPTAPECLLAVNTSAAVNVHSKISMSFAFWAVIIVLINTSTIYLGQIIV